MYEIECFLYNLIIRYVQNTLKDIYIKCYNELLMFILMISKKYNIDESHDISHSMDVLHFANDIYEQQVYLYPPLVT